MRSIAGMPAAYRANDDRMVHEIDHCRVVRPQCRIKLLEPERFESHDVFG